MEKHVYENDFAVGYTWPWKGWNSESCGRRRGSSLLGKVSVVFSKIRGGKNTSQSLGPITITEKEVSSLKPRYFIHRLCNSPCFFDFFESTGEETRECQSLRGGLGRRWKILAGTSCGCSSVERWEKESFWSSWRVMVGTDHKCNENGILVDPVNLFCHSSPSSGKTREWVGAILWKVCSSLWGRGLSGPTVSLMLEW